MLHKSKHPSCKTSVKLDRIDTEKLKDQAAEVASALSGGAHQAKEWGAPKVDAVVEWVTPRLEQAWNETVKVAAPQVEKAAGKAAPVIDSAHDKLVDDILPKIVAALNEAAKNASETAHVVGDSINAAADKAPAAVADAVAKVDKHAKKEKKSHKGFWIFSGLAAAIAGVVLWRRSQPTTDPWAEPWEKVDTTDVEGAVGNAAEAVGEAAGAAVAKTRDVSSKVAESVEELSEKVTDKISDVKDAAKKTTSRARPAAKAKADDAEAAAEKAGDAVKSAADAAQAKAEDVTETVEDKIDDATTDTGENK